MAARGLAAASAGGAAGAVRGGAGRPGVGGGGGAQPLLAALPHQLGAAPDHSYDH